MDKRFFFSSATPCNYAFSSKSLIFQKHILFFTSDKKSWVSLVDFIYCLAFLVHSGDKLGIGVINWSCYYGRKNTLLDVGLLICSVKSAATARTWKGLLSGQNSFFLRFGPEALGPLMLAFTCASVTRNVPVPSKGSLYKSICLIFTSWLTLSPFYLNAQQQRKGETEGEKKSSSIC